VVSSRALRACARCSSTSTLRSWTRGRSSTHSRTCTKRCRRPRRWSCRAVASRCRWRSTTRRSREAVNRYRITTRPEAPNVVEGNNIDYIVRYNGLPDRDAFYARVLGAEWWNAFTGFYPGLPSLLPLDPRSELVAPKYNPARTWTPEGAVAIGGPCLVIHPLESPGSYQLFGRTLPISALVRRSRNQRLDPVLIEPGDRVRFERVEEAELIEIRRQVFEGGYDYRIEPGTYSVGDHLAESARSEGEAATSCATRRAAAARVKVP
jgi:urea carboxylase